MLSIIQPYPAPVIDRITDTNFLLISNLLANQKAPLLAQRDPQKKPML